MLKPILKSIEYVDNYKIVIVYKKVKISTFSPIYILAFITPIILLLYFQSLLYFFLIIPFIAICSLLIVFIDMKNKNFEHFIIKKELNSILNKIATSYGENIYCVDTSYNYNNREKNNRHLLALFSNGIEVKFTIIPIQCYNDKQVLKCSLKYEEVKSI